MVVKGRVVDQETQKAIHSVKVHVFRDQDDTSRYKVLTDLQGQFEITVPDDLLAGATDKQRTLQLTATRWDYDPMEMTIASATPSVTTIDLVIQMEAWKGRIGRRAYAAGTVVLLALLSLLAVRLYTGVLFYHKGRLLPDLEISAKKIQEHLNTAKDEFFAGDQGKKWRKDLEPPVQQLSEATEKLRKVVGVRPAPASRLRAFLLSLWVPAFLEEAFWQNQYWWNVVAWSVFGGLVGLLWVTVRSVVDENFKPKYLSTIPYRLLGAPFYAIVLIFFARVIGFATEAIATLEKTPSPAPTQLSSGLAMAVAFLIGLFVERAHLRLRSFAERLFPSEYLGGKAKR